MDNLILHFTWEKGPESLWWEKNLLENYWEMHTRWSDVKIYVMHDHNLNIQFCLHLISAFMLLPPLPKYICYPNFTFSNCDICKHALRHGSCFIIFSLNKHPFIRVHNQWWIPSSVKTIQGISLLMPLKFKLTIQHYHNFLRGINLIKIKHKLADICLFMTRLPSSTFGLQCIHSTWPKIRSCWKRM